MLLKLRHQQVLSVSQSDYTKLVAQFANETRREIEDTWNWLALRTTIQVNTEEGAPQYILDGVGNSRFKVLEVINDTDNYYLENMTSSELTKRFLMNEQVLQAPRYYGFNGFDSLNNPIVDVYPIPDKLYEINFNLVLPQNDLVGDAEEFKVPGHLIVLGTYVKALVERGEDASSGYQVALAQYQDAVAANISQESAVSPGEEDWYAV